MTRGLADTSLFIARETSRALNEAAVPDGLAVSAITIGSCGPACSSRWTAKPELAAW